VCISKAYPHKNKHTQRQTQREKWCTWATIIIGPFLIQILTSSKEQ
jgi:hypothetical protein